MKIWLSLICVVAIAIIPFWKGCGGSGLGRGGGNDDDSESKTNQTEQITDNTTTQVTCIEITISGTEYLYQGEPITIDALLEKAKEIKAEIRIYTDKTATINALDDIEDALKDNNLTYHIGDQ